MNLNKKILFKEIKITISRWGFSREGLFLNSKGEWYLLSQIVLILLHLITPYPKIEKIPFWVNTFFIIIGSSISIQVLIISIQAFNDLGHSLTPLPYSMYDSNLIRNKSYQKTRHPLYKGLLFISLGICTFYLSLIPLHLLLLLAYILKIKAIKEEERLKIKFAEYKKYIKEVPAIMRHIKYLDWRSLNVNRK